MDVIYGLIPSVIIVGILVVIAIIWAAKKGQFDDLDGAASRILMNDDDQPFADPSTKAKTEAITTDKTNV